MRKIVSMFITLVVMASTTEASSLKTESNFVGEIKKVQKATSLEKQGLRIAIVGVPPVKCFEVTYYLSCGYAWEGNLCISGSGPFLTNEQFVVGWNFKNKELCGPNAPWVP